jgi:transcription antitermination factor NusG
MGHQLLEAARTVSTVTVPVASGGDNPASDGPARAGFGVRIDLDLAWYVLVVAEGREGTVAERLAGREGVPGLLGKGRAWVPKEFRYVRASRHAKAKSRPVSATLLPGYCFAAVSDLQSWRAIHDLRGRDGGRLVWGALAVDGRPARVPMADMARLMAEAGRFVPYTTAASARQRLQAKAAVGGAETVHGTAYAGLSAKIQSVAGDRVKAWLPMLGSLRLVELPVAAFVGPGEDDVAA